MTDKVCTKCSMSDNCVRLQQLITTETLIDKLRDSILAIHDNSKENALILLDELRAATHELDSDCWEYNNDDVE